jgi:hypothetical protein
MRKDFRRAVRPCRPASADIQTPGLSGRTPIQVSPNPETHCPTH